MSIHSGCSYHSCAAEPPFPIPPWTGPWWITAAANAFGTKTSLTALCSQQCTDVRRKSHLAIALVLMVGDMELPTTPEAPQEMDLCGALACLDAMRRHCCSTRAESHC